MTEKHTYWFADADGRRVAAKGAEQRDELRATGWQDAAEPADTDLVWMRHETTGQYAPLAAVTLDVWAGRGWHPAVPPADHPTDVAAVTAVQPLTEPASTESSTADAAGQEPPQKTDPKEQRRA